VISRSRAARVSGRVGFSTGGTQLVSRTRRVTSKRRMGPSSLSSTSWVPIGCAAKSMTTSARSAGESTSSVSFAGFGSSPPSPPIWIISAPPRVKWKLRWLEALRMRNRYLRLATGKYGCTLPFAIDVSRVLYGSPNASKNSCPFSSNAASRIISGTSNWPVGSPIRFSASLSIR
jgi:hypothetical protein